MSEPSLSDQATIEFDHVFFRLNGRDLLHDINLSVHQGETLVLLGRSGSGKTTTLKLINHLVSPSSGQVRVAAKATQDWDPIRLRRGIGYVIQDGGLFPHFTVERNIALIPEIENWPRERVQARVRELLGTVGLTEEIARRYPGELSGGQRQRVGVARALAADPPILLLDEAFGALDPITRSEMQHEFSALQKRLKKTVVFVTHDLREALLLGDRIVLMEDGKIVADLPVGDFPHSEDPLVEKYVEAFSGSGRGEVRI